MIATLVEKNANLDEGHAKLIQELREVQNQFWNAEAKIRHARTEKSRDAWTAIRDGLKPQYQQLLAQYKENC